MDGTTSGRKRSLRRGLLNAFSRLTGRCLIPVDELKRLHSLQAEWTGQRAQISELEKDADRRNARVKELEQLLAPSIRVGTDEDVPRKVIADPGHSEQRPTAAYYPFPELPGVAPEWLSIGVVDVGAEALDFEGDVYAPLFAQGRHTLVGFDPFADSAIQRADNPVRPPVEVLESYPNVQRLILPYFIGDGRKRRFHVNRFSPTSSLFPSNLGLLSQFSHLPAMCETVRQFEVQTRRLDDVHEIERCDYLKVDVQGADYEVIAHGTRVLRETLFVHIESEFSPVYEGQPLFADIDPLLRQQGFELIDLVKLGWNNYRAMPSSVVKSRLLWADSIYMKSPHAIAAANPNLLFRAAYIAHANYRKYDLAAHLIEHYDRLSGTDYRSLYVRSF